MSSKICWKSVYGSIPELVANSSSVEQPLGSYTFGILMRQLSFRRAGWRHGEYLKRLGAAVVGMHFFFITGQLSAAPTLHEQLLASDAGLRQIDEAHSSAYRLFRSILDKDTQQQLKREQIAWIDELNRTLAQTPPSQRGQVVMLWTEARTQSLRRAYGARTGIPQAEDTPISPAGGPEPTSPEMTPKNRGNETDQALIRTVTELGTDISNYWKDGLPDQLPKPLSSALVDRLERMVPLTKSNQEGEPQGSYRGLRLAYEVHNALIEKTLDLGRIAQLLEQGEESDGKHAPWIERITKTLQSRRSKSLALQEEALALIGKSDTLAAKSRMELAVKEYPSAGLSAYSSALALYEKLSQDKALRAVDGDWKMPTLPDHALIGQADAQATALRAHTGNEILPALSTLVKGMETAAILGKFSTDYEAAGSADKPHPIRALQIMRNSEKYGKLKSDDSIFARPFLERMKYLDELIGPKAKDYETHFERGAALEKENKFLDAAASYRTALSIEYSKDLEQVIHRCEAKTSGL